MATAVRTEPAGRCYKHVWALTTADPIGDAVEFPGASDRTIQFSGTWGGATAEIQGSLDGITFFVLTDPQGNAITKTADAIETIMENVTHIRAKLTVVGAGAVISAILLSRSTMS